MEGFCGHVKSKVAGLIADNPASIATILRNNLKPYTGDYAAAELVKILVRKQILSSAGEPSINKITAQR